MRIHDVVQGEEEWHNLRAGIPTASDFSLMVTSKGEESKSLPAYAAKLAAEKYAGRPLDDFGGTWWMKLGKEREALAVARYEYERDVEVQRVGFITDDEGRWGVSPDGLVGDDGAIEVKCLKPEVHVKTIAYYRKNKKSPPEYVQQIQGEIMIPGRKWVDQIFYHPDLPMLVIRHTPNKDVQAGLRKALVKVEKEREALYEALVEQNKVW